MSAFNVTDRWKVWCQRQLEVLFLLLSDLEIRIVWHNNSVSMYVYCISEHSFNGKSVSVFCFIKIYEVKLDPSCMKPSNSLLY